jgi:hypothetical protein
LAYLSPDSLFTPSSENSVMAKFAEFPFCEVG